MPPNPDVRWRQRFDHFKAALARLKKATALAQERELTDLEQHGLIKAFEFTHELAWKTLKDYALARGSTSRLHGSRDATRETFALDLIQNGDAWMRMIDHRNDSVHAYNEATANEIAGAILMTYASEFSELAERLGTIAEEEP